ncbi:DUF2304 family protein [Candidatus Woesearchaeota archaeon]|nr:DUF2304 family protein [Candidatus Woesearchaeota archaeon]
MVEAISVIIIIFALFAWSRALLRFKDKKIKGSEFSFWTLIWLSVLVLSLNPELAGLISFKLGIERPVDLVVYSSVLLLFYLNFRIYVKQEKTEQEITELVRELALRKK